MQRMDAINYNTYFKTSFLEKAARKAGKAGKKSSSMFF